ncbi:MAG: carotenoid oxygenase family protein [Synechococcales cyanobacterium]
MNPNPQSHQWSSAPALWSRAIAQPAREFELQPLSVLSGHLPLGLRGSLYRNGPARFERGQQRVQHWFDGDGAILALHFDGHSCHGVYRYVQTPQFIAESQRNQLLFNNYGTLPPGPWWQRWGKPFKNVANTSVLPLPDRLLALWEGGRPIGLDSTNLMTLGVEDLGRLRSNATFSAHPKIDPQTGDIYNFGVQPGLTNRIHLYKSNPTGHIVQEATVPLSGIPLIHDWVMAGPYLIFCIPPVRLNPWLPLLSLQSLSQALEWIPKLGTEIIVIHRETLKVISRRFHDPWFQWHFSNAYVPSPSFNRVVLELVRYPNFDTNRHLKEVSSGQLSLAAPSGYWQLHLDPQSATILDFFPLLADTCEFPTIDPRFVGKPHRFAYVAIHHPHMDERRELFSAIACIDCHTGAVTRAELGTSCYPSEPIYVVDAENPSQGWVLTIVFNGSQESSEVWIYNAQCLESAPHCRLALPNSIPLGFHGAWKSIT